MVFIIILKKKKKKTKDTSAFIPPVLQNRTHFFLSPVCLWSLGEHVTSRFKNEVERMGFDMNNAWRISNINEKYRWVVFGPCGLCSMTAALSRNPNSHVAEHLNLKFFFKTEFYLLNITNSYKHINNYK